MGKPGGKLSVRDVSSGIENDLPVNDTNNKNTSDWSRDGRFLFYTVTHPQTQGDIWVMRNPLDGETRAEPLIVTKAFESQAQLSPDGRWIAYTSDESGEFALYVRSFPDVSHFGVRLSPGSGLQPRWRSDGGELYYLSQAGDRFTFHGVAVSSAGSDKLQLGETKKLFEVSGRGLVPRLNAFLYSPASKGQKFLVNVLTDRSEPTLNVVTNWRQTVMRD
jgi:hypothetical protein